MYLCGNLSEKKTTYPAVWYWFLIPFNDKQISLYNKGICVGNSWGEELLI